ncbi:SAM-dependent methyltransferase [Clostridioides difficile]|uniref:SAM-dependent methyltransferase n=1 Tax=Clostridioides difficile TaxID=1496 RepID=UPI0008730E56|nr:methyltransferase domain-containing protein [Clostridioides difficile]AXU63421.1 methyltransferase type 11 [Clostridioides difficile]AXU74364.1 methyltransferase type 11 [Clostridioides difficile]EGT4038376.1 methyltransferase domain-containing protein [Clostridioides difficile]EGT5089112.1 methyltransferase domain-containing protein [Clostridioides difficile]EGT5494268.1 methyltransferase domain-containing protein [Clostridioides difficile]
MIFTKSNKYDKDFLMENMMGPNCIKILEELTSKIKLEKGMRILDLGCGKGISSIFLAKEFDATVFATDLWIEPTENYKRFKEFKLDDKIFPIQAEAHELPYAEGFFDAVISVDSYHYFGNKEGFLDNHISPLVKEGGILAMAMPGLKEDFVDCIPDELIPFWQDNMNFHSITWWNKLWSESESVIVEKCEALNCHDEAWKDWINCDNSYAINDKKMMEVENGKYFNTISLIARTK